MSYRDFIFASEQVRRDTARSLRHVRTLTVSYRNIPRFVAQAPPEEATTFNLALMLASNRGTNTAVVLHSRLLEGGRRDTAIQPSGADLQVAIEWLPEQWLDLVLQAKRYHPASRAYRGWDITQNQTLIRWAKENGSATPGMLLYNAACAPFPTKSGSRTDLFGGCCHRAKLKFQRRVHKTSAAPWMAQSPLAISIVDDQHTMSTLSDPSPEAIRDVAYPWECLFCPERTNPTSKGAQRRPQNGQNGEQSVDMPPRRPAPEKPTYQPTEIDEISELMPEGFEREGGPSHHGSNYQPPQIYQLSENAPGWAVALTSGAADARLLEEEGMLNASVSMVVPYNP